MKVLFVASGNAKNGEIVPFIKAQGESLRRAGVDIAYFPIVGKGLQGYLKGAARLRAWLKEHPVDLIHAHYTLSGWTAVLVRPKVPIVLSLMGTDAYGQYVGKGKVELSSRYLTLLTWLVQPFVSRLISKSENIERFVYRKKISHIIPNGVFLEQFAPSPGGYRAELGLQPGKRYVLFLGNAKDPRKNYALAAAAVQRLNRPGVELINPYPIAHDAVAKYFNSVDVFAMCSFMEGSPNVIKEAMACNCPLVATDVGDAAWVIGNTPGCGVATFDADDYAAHLARCLDFAEKHGRTNGRERLKKLGLGAEQVAKQIAALYQNTIAIK